MARTSRFLAPLMTLALLLSSAALVLPPQQVLAANEVWDVRMEFTAIPTGGNWLEPNPLVFGSSATATTGFDGAPNDIVAPGAAPAPNDAYAYFTSSSSNCREERQPYLGPNPGDSLSWTLRLIADSAGASSLNLDWGDIAGVASFPLDASIVLSGGGQTINMRTQQTATYSSGSNYTLTITVTRLGTPDEVWVDDDWCETEATDGEVVGDGYVFGYNAFCGIQDGVDAIEADDPDDGGTVHVISSEGSAEYSPFTISENNVEVLGEDGAVVSGGATIDHANGVTIQNLEFSGTVYCNNTTDTNLVDLSVTGLGGGNGINIDGAEETVTIDNASVMGFANGINVVEDTAIITNSAIWNCTNGIRAALDADVTLTGSDIWSCTNGVYLISTSRATVNGCCNIYNNNYGFYGDSSATLTAHGNSVYDNYVYGALWLSSGTADCHCLPRATGTSRFEIAATPAEAGTAASAIRPSVDL